MKRINDYSAGLQLRLVVWSLAVVLFSATSQAATLHSYSAANVNVPDYPAGGANSSLTLSGAASGSTITAVKVYYEIRHTYIGDLQVWLTAYYGGAWHDYLLRGQSGGNGQSIVETKSNLTSWNGASPNQTWYLVVKDLATGDVGYIDFFEIWVDYSTPGTPNLAPYQPSGWSDKIVVSRSTGNNTDSTSLTTADTLYVDWAVINNGTAATSVRFYTEIYVDGALRTSWYSDPPVNTGTWQLVQDYSIGSLSAGTHTIRIKTDSTSVIGESNEGDNEYTKTISVSTPSQPNLTPYQPSGWADKIVVSRATGNNADSTSLTTADTLYLDWAVINNGNASVGALFYTELYVDGVLKFTWNTTPPLGTSGYTSVSDYPIGSLTAGTHTLKIKTDSTGVIGESNEGDNEYTKTISVATAGQPNLTPYRPSGWSDKIVVSRTAGNNTDSTSLTAADSLYVDWAVINSGNAAVGSTFYTALYVDGVLKYSWFTSPPLNANYYTSVYDYNIGALSAGTHTISITTDSTAIIGESSEADNTYTKTISVAGTSLPDFIVTSISLSPSSPQPGQAFTAYVTVKNQGSGTGDGKWLDVWANQPASQVPGADGDRWTSVGTLTSGQSKTFTFSLTAGSAGSQIFRAFVDSASQTTESNEANNQTTFSYNVVQLAQSPDFIVTSITLSPTSPSAGQTFTANVTVKNQGAGSGDGKWLDVWANQPSAPPAGTDGNTWASVGTLSAGQSKTFTLTLTAPASAGAYTFRAFVDSYAQTMESNEANNQTTLSYNVGAVAQPPDFVVTAITFNPAQPVGGQPFTAYVTVKNQGAGPGDGKYLDVWLNQAAPPPSGAPGDQYRTVGTLAAGQSKTLTFNLSALPGGAPWTFRAFVDSGEQTAESNDANNQTTVSYGLNPVLSPDFLITSITISPSSLKPGDKFSASITVKNQGAGSGDGGWLDAWANKSTPVSSGDSGDSYSAVGVLASGQSKVITVANLTAPSAGNNTLRVFVDSTSQTLESNEANNQATFNYSTSKKVLLLLHGMNAGPDTWDDYVDIRFNGSAPIISGGQPVSLSSPIPNADGVVCYRVDFGWYEIDGSRTGVEGITAGGDEKHGDFSTFTQLGQEVWDAIHYILSVHPGAQVTILGHSRGGLAARAFLQTATSSPEKSSVVALLTTGTPHKGSRLGRIYSYLADPAHPRTTDSTKYWKADWDVANELQAQLDVRRPTISDLSDDSSAISSLSSSIGNLPSSPKYGAITYTSVELGLLKRDAGLYFDYSIFSDATQAYGVGPQVSTEAEAYMLGAGNTPLSYLGDGIVPVTSQRYDDIPSFPGSTLTPFPHTGSTIHTGEPGQEAHMSDALKTLIAW